MDPAAFRRDVEQRPLLLRILADALDGGWPGISLSDDFDASSGRVVLTGMGSSLSASHVAALRLRRAGIVAVAESAAVDATLELRPGDLAIGISASGESEEPLRLWKSAAWAGAKRMAITNRAGSSITSDADVVVELLAGAEAGGVACVSFTNTLVALLAVEQSLCGDRSGTDLAALVRRAADAADDLLQRRDCWLQRTTELLTTGDGTYLIAPAERVSSALQGALMLREGPRRPATGCETGDWAHVDVYLTKTLDYRALLHPGSRWDANALRWLRERSATVVASGAEVAGATSTIRYRHDDDVDVRLLVETTVPELVAAEVWSSA